MINAKWELISDLSFQCSEFFPLVELIELNLSQYLLTSEFYRCHVCVFNLASRQLKTLNSPDPDHANSI